MFCFYLHIFIIFSTENQLEWVYEIWITERAFRSLAPDPHNALVHCKGFLSKWWHEITFRDYMPKISAMSAFSLYKQWIQSQDELYWSPYKRRIYFRNIVIFGCRSFLYYGRRGRAVVLKPIALHAYCSSRTHITQLIYEDLKTGCLSEWLQMIKCHDCSIKVIILHTYVAL